MKILLFNQYITESSIGSENIRIKHYPDMDKKQFYKIVNIDPTSVRKKDFSKPGKYSKWLLREFKKGTYNDYFSDESFTKELNYKLFVFSTQWFKNKFNKSAYYVSGYKGYMVDGDILKFDLIQFYNYMDEYILEYKTITEDSKYDVIYENDDYTILVPLNFSGSYETAQNTDWCSKAYPGYSMWIKISILFRVIPKDKSYEKLKITWTKKHDECHFASQKYPEIVIKDENPFDLILDECDKLIQNWKNNNSYVQIKRTFELLNDESKQLMIQYRNKFKNNND